MDSSNLEYIFKELGEITDDHAKAMAEMSKALIELSKVTEQTLQATRKTVEVSKRLSLLLMVIPSIGEEIEN